MANGKVAGYRLELRMAIADGLINGREFDEIRGYLVEAGVAEADLPSDHSIRTFQESVEYDMMYRRRVEAIELRTTAGSLAGVAAARVEIIQARALEKLESWMDAGLVESADMFKSLAFTLQFQRQALAGRKLRADLGDAELPEPMGPKMISKARFDEVVARFVAEAEAANAAAAADTDDAVEELDDDERVARILEDSGYPRIPAEDTDDATAARPPEADEVYPAASARMSQDNAASARMMEDTAGETTADPDGLGETSRSVGRSDAPAASARQNPAGSARIVEEDAASARIVEDVTSADEDEELLAATGTDDAAGGWFAGASFRNSPSSAARTKARNKRKKRRR